MLGVLVDLGAVGVALLLLLLQLVLEHLLLVLDVHLVLLLVQQELVQGALGLLLVVHSGLERALAHALAVHLLGQVGLVLAQNNGLPVQPLEKLVVVALGLAAPLDFGRVPGAHQQVRGPEDALALGLLQVVGVGHAALAILQDAVGLGQVGRSEVAGVPALGVAQGRGELAHRELRRAALERGILFLAVDLGDVGVFFGGLFVLEAVGGNLGVLGGGRI